MESTLRRPAMLGASVGIVGAVLVALGSILPRLSTTEFAGIADNTFVQGGGWWFLVLAGGLGLTFAGSLAVGSENHRGGRSGMGLSIVTLAAAVWQGFYEKSSRTLYSIDPLTGQPDLSSPGAVASAGIGTYMIVFGAALAVIGAYIVLSANRQAEVIDGAPDRIRAALDEYQIGRVKQAQSGLQRELERASEYQNSAALAQISTVAGFMLDDLVKRGGVSGRKLRSFEELARRAEVAHQAYPEPSPELLTAVHPEGVGSLIERLERLVGLRDAGALSEAEFTAATAQEKARASLDVPDRGVTTNDDVI